MDGSSSLIVVGCASFSLQVLAAYLAIRLIPVSRGYSAWIFIAAAALLMAFRRAIPLYRVLFDQGKPAGDVFAEVVALFISLFLVVAMVLVKRIFLSLRQAEEGLAAEKERLAVTLRSIGEGVISANAAGSVETLNRTAEELTGWRQEEAIGQPLDKVFSLAPSALPHRFVLAGRDGSLRPVARTASEIHGPEKRVLGSVVVFRDVSVEERVEQEALKTQKLESLSLIAGGIAHDFNNLLTGIVGNLSLVRTLVPGEGRVRDCLEEAEKAGMRAHLLTQQLLTFARGGAPVRKVVDLADLVRESALFAIHGSPVRGSFSFPAGLWPVQADPGQLSQVVHNLVLNAVQAMPRGGEVRIGGANQTLEGGNPFGLPAGRYARVWVEDDGPGVSEKVRGVIFDPFFTTKPGGSGLGLASTFSILRRHGGAVALDPPAGKGATFTFFLPASGEGPQEEKAPPAGLFQTGRVLVMDDEPSIRQIAGQFLEHLGCRFSLASEGKEAVEAVRRARDEGDPFSTAILDLTIPAGMGGKEAVKGIREAQPGIKAIVSSGYSNDPVMAEYASFGFDAALLKPYRLEEFRQALASLFPTRA
jgi:two-component system, cell cycle sensor histidine kinase and response regulator CckA